MFLRLQCNRSVISGLVTCASFLHAPRDVPTVIGRGVPNMHGWCAEPSVCNPPKGSQAPHTRGSEWEQGRTPAGHGGETLPRSLHSEGMGPDTSLPRQRGPVPGGCQGAQRAPCCLPLLLPPFPQHFVPTVNYKHIPHGGRSSDKPCGSRCSRKLLPVCWPWHFSHSFCRKSQCST